MRKHLLLYYFVFLYTVQAFGTGSPFTSTQSGNWNVGSTWGNAGNTEGVDFPTAGQTATIASGHAVVIPSTFNATIATLTIFNIAGSSLTIDYVNPNRGSLTFTGVLTTGTLSKGKLNVNGLLSVEEGATIVNAATTTLTIGANGIYRHNYVHTAGTVYTATWNVGATLEFTGYDDPPTTPPDLAIGGLTQAFRNVVWNCPNQSEDIALLGNTIFATVNGNFSILNTGGFLLGLSHSVNRTLNWNGSLVLGTGVIFDLNSDVVNNKNTTLNLKGGISIGSDDGIAIQSSGIGTVNFNGPGISSPQSFTNTFELSTPVNFTITSPAFVDISDGNFIPPGPGDFTLNSGATLRVGSVDGLVQGSGAGNVQNNGIRTYTGSGNIVYNGTSNQNLGDEWDSSGALNGVAVNLEINTSNGAVVNNNIVGNTDVVGILTLTSGVLNIGNSNTLDVQGIFNGNGGTVGGDITSSLAFSGSGSINGTLIFTSGAQNLKNLTLSRSANVVLGSPLTINSSGSISFASTGNLQFSGQTLTVNGNISQSGPGALSCPAPFASTNLVIGGTGALSSLPFCTSCGTMDLNNLTLGRTSLGTYTISSAVRVNGTISLNSGTFTHSSGLTMVSGSTFSRNSGTTYSGSSPGTTGSYNVNYNGNLTTSGELPSNSTDLNNLNTAGNITLNSDITMNGSLSITSGTFSAGNHDITIYGANFSVNGGAFTINSGKTVTFARAGTTALGGTSVGGTQFGNLTINSGAALSAPNAIIAVAGTWDNNGTFTANTGTVSFNGAAQGIDPNGQSFNNVDFSGSSIKTLQGQLDVNGTLIINSTLDVGANQTINVAGTWTNNGIFVSSGGTVNFTGAAQSINSNSQPFFNLTMAGTGTKVLSAPIDINGSLTINSGVTLNVGLGNQQMNVAGNWINNGTFTKRSGTVVFDGTSTISGTTTTQFNHVTITGALTSAGSIDVSGNWLQSSGTFTSTGGTLIFSGGNASITPGGQTFNNVTINAAVTKTLLGSTVINGVLTLTSGTFDSNGKSLNLKGNFVSNSPALSILTTSTVTFSGTTTITGGAAPTFGAIIISGILTPNAAFNVNGNLVNNGTLNAGSGTVTFGGATTISGSSVCSFNNVMISSILTAPAGNLNVAGDWTNDGTFNPGATGTIIFNGTTTMGGASISSFANVQVTGTVTAAPTFNVASNFTNNGTFTAGTGTVIFNGTSTQSISGSTVTTFNNISVTNSSATPAVQVQSNQNMAGVLTLATNSVFDADGSTNNRIFTLLSSADNPTIDASVAILPTGASVTGNVTVQRYMSIEGNNGGRIYRYISSPVQNATVSQIQSFIPVTGTFTGASSCSGCSSVPSMYLYDETVITDINGYNGADYEDGYIAFPVASNSEVFAPGRGYSIFVRANIAPISGAGSALWSLSGPINSGNVTLPVSFTSSGTLANDGLNLVGNPYPSTIDWDAAGWTRSNLDNTTYMIDNGLASPVYATHVAGGASANGGSRYISAGQAFYVKGTGGGSPSLQASESVKASGTQTTFFRTQAIQDIMRITLRQGTKADETVIQFKKGATENFDLNLDAYKLNNPTPMFSLATITAHNRKDLLKSSDKNPISPPGKQSAFQTTVESQRYVINTIATPTTKTEVPLDITSVTPGSYLLGFTEFDSFTNPQVVISLRDDFLGTMTNIKDNPNYKFDITADAKSFGSARFTIVFDVAQNENIELEAEHITVYPNPTKNKISVEVKSDNDVKAKVISLTGAPLYEKDLVGGTTKKGSFDLEEQADGMYILIIQDGSMTYQKRIIKKR